MTLAIIRTIKPLLKAAFVIGLLYYLSQRGFISFQETKRAFTQWPLLAWALFLLIANLFVGILRWQWLLQAQGIHLPLRRVTQLSFIGNFFNIALPGAVSGDFVKAFYIGKELHGQRSRAFGSILFDRLAGLSALVLVSAGATLAGRVGDATVSRTLFFAIRPFLVAAAVGVIVFYGYLFLVREHHDPLLTLLRMLERKHRKFGSLARIYEGVRHYHNHRLAVTKVLAVSIFIHLIVGYGFLLFAQALGETQLSLTPVLVVVPLGLLVTAIPIAPAGVGTGHAAFLYFFSLLGSNRGADVFTLFALSNIFMGAVGGLIYLRFRAHEPKPTLDSVPLA